MPLQFSRWLVCASAVGIASMGHVASADENGDGVLSAEIPVDFKTMLARIDKNDDESMVPTKTWRIEVLASAEKTIEKSLIC